MFINVLNAVQIKLVMRYHLNVFNAEKVKHG